MESLVAWFMEHPGQYISREAIVFIISMCPLLELRGGILASVFLDLPMWKSVILCVTGNIIPIPFILAFIKKIIRWMEKTRLFGKIAGKLINKVEKKKGSIEKFEFWGLVAFVGVPAPGTGAWTGSLIAALLDVKLRKAVAAELLGIVIATVIMCLVSYGIIGNVIA